MTAAALVRKRLTTARIRPVDLAKQIGVTPEMAGLILKGKRNLAIWHLDAVADMLKCESVAELFVTPPVIPGTEHVSRVPKQQEVELHGLAAPSRPSVAPDVAAELVKDIEDIHTRLNHIQNRLAARGTGLPDPAEATDPLPVRKTRRAPQRRRRGRR